MLPRRPHRRPPTTMIGVHLDQPQQAAFNQCHISVEDLTLWVRLPPSKRGSAVRVVRRAPGEQLDIPHAAEVAAHGRTCPDPVHVPDRVGDLAVLGQ